MRSQISARLALFRQAVAARSGTAARPASRLCCQAASSSAADAVSSPTMDRSPSSETSGRCPGQFHRPSVELDGGGVGDHGGPRPCRRRPGGRGLDHRRIGPSDELRHNRRQGIVLRLQHRLHSDERSDEMGASAWTGCRAEPWINGAEADVTADLPSAVSISDRVGRVTNFGTIGGATQASIYNRSPACSAKQSPGRRSSRLRRLGRKRRRRWPPRPDVGGNIGRSGHASNFGLIGASTVRMRYLTNHLVTITVTNGYSVGLRGRVGW